MLGAAGAGLFARLGDTGGAGAGRIDILAPHLQAALRQPWFGYGLGGFRRVDLSIITPASFSALYDLGAMHDVYLQWFEQAGVLGAASMFACVASLLWSVALRARGRGPEARFARAVAAASVVLLVQGLSDYALEVPSISATWTVLLAAVVAVPAGRALRRRARGRRRATAPAVRVAGSPASGPLREAADGGVAGRLGDR